MFKLLTIVLFLIFPFCVSAQTNTSPVAEQVADAAVVNRMIGAHNGCIFMAFAAFRAQNVVVTVDKLKQVDHFCRTVATDPDFLFLAPTLVERVTSPAIIELFNTAANDQLAAYMSNLDQFNKLSQGSTKSNNKTTTPRIDI